jgi:hypothetical protein
MAERRSQSTARTGQIGVIILEPLPVVREGLALLVDSFPGCSVLARVGEPEDAIERRSDVHAVSGSPRSSH